MKENKFRNSQADIDIIKENNNKSCDKENNPIEDVYVQINLNDNLKNLNLKYKKHQEEVNEVSYINRENTEDLKQSLINPKERKQNSSDENKYEINCEKQDDHKFKKSKEALNRRDAGNLAYKTGNKHSLLELTINCIGYGRYQVICMIVSLFCFAAYGINLTIFASMAIPMQKFFKLSDFQLSIISSMLYLGTSLGHLVTGFITKRFTRRQTVICLLCLISIFSFFIGFIKNLLIFSFFRIIIGFGIGTLMPLVINTLNEFLPNYNKAFFLMLTLTGVYLGQLFPNFLMYIFIPELDEKNVDLVQKISAMVALIALFFSLFLFEDSPISLVIQGENEKALKLIQKMDQKLLYTEEKKQQLFIEMKNKFSIEDKEKSLSALFASKYRKSTILLIFIWFINSILFFGPAIIVSLTIDKLGISLDKKSIIVNQIKIIAIGLLGFLVGGYLSEFKLIGRLRTIMLGFFLLMIFVFLTILIPKHFSIFYGIAYSATPLFYFMTPIYTAEFYPSRLRDLGLGFLYFLNKIGGLSSQFIFIHLAEINTNLPFYAIILLSGLNIIFIALMPYETLNKNMDFMESWDIGKKEASSDGCKE